MEKFAPTERVVTGATWLADGITAAAFSLRPGASLADRIILPVLAVVCVLAGAAAFQRCVHLTPAGLTDVSGFRKRRFVPITDIGSASMDRVGGLLDGFCVRLHMRDGSSRPLRGSRCYSRLPTPTSLPQLADFTQRVNDHLDPQS